MLVLGLTLTLLAAAIDGKEPVAALKRREAVR
jgi:hypothetical protein